MSLKVTRPSLSRGFMVASVALVLYALSVEGRPILAVAKDEERLLICRPTWSV